MKLKKVNNEVKQSDNQETTGKSLFSKNKSKEDQQKPKYNSLREVMDLERPFSMMFSGVEDDSNFQILYDMGIRNFLISFHYVQKKHLNTSKYEEMGVKFFVDSGAFTFISNLEFQD